MAMEIKMMAAPGSGGSAMPASSSSEPSLTINPSAVTSSLSSLGKKLY
jgi:hypothetical protein